jgi:hypothetical protein
LKQRRSFLFSQKMEAREMRMAIRINTMAAIDEPPMLSA